MPRRRFVWSPEANALVEVDTSYKQQQVAPTIIPDIPDYVSPVTGLWVNGRKQRREDMKRTGSRPWEGMAQEKKEAQRREAYKEERFHQSLDKAARTAFHQMSPEKRRILERG